MVTLINNTNHPVRFSTSNIPTSGQLIPAGGSAQVNTQSGMAIAWLTFGSATNQPGDVCVFNIPDGKTVTLSITVQ